jgi:hypothetical protein
LKSFFKILAKTITPLCNSGKLLLEGFPAASVVERFANAWHASAPRLYRNWLSGLAAHREQPRRKMPATAM